MCEVQYRVAFLSGMRLLLPVSPLSWLPLWLLYCLQLCISSYPSLVHSLKSQGNSELGNFGLWHLLAWREKQPELWLPLGQARACIVAESVQLRWVSLSVSPVSYSRTVIHASKQPDHVSLFSRSIYKLSNLLQWLCQLSFVVCCYSY